MPNEVGVQDALKRGAVLRGYSIREVLGRGGFGIVYRARHLELGYQVAVKEYLPRDLAVRVGLRVQPTTTACIEAYRDGLRRFRDEGKALVELHDHPNVVSCRDFFRCHGTAYLVMEFEHGTPLSEILKRREGEGRPFSKEDLMAVAIPLIEGLRRVHEAGVVHRDIKPSNVLLRQNDRQPVLIDFGAAKQDMATGNKSIAPRTPGYAAWEQVVPEGALGPWTDIYAIGVLLWRIVSGGAPTESPVSLVTVESRMDAFVRGLQEPMPSATLLGEGRFNASILAAIDGCLKLKHDERVQDCTELIQLLREDPEFQYRLGMKYFESAAEPYFSEPQHDNYGNHDLHHYVYSDVFKWYRLTTDHDEHLRNQGGLLSEAVRWLQLAASENQKDAQHHLAFMTFYGIQVDCSIQCAMRWWTKAASSGHTEAQYTLGIICIKTYVNAEFGDECEDFNRFGGQDTYLLTEQDYEGKYTGESIPYEAAKWLCTAADSNHRNARVVLATVSGEYRSSSNPSPFAQLQYMIGKLYHNGEDIPRNYTRALVWYRIAAQWGNEEGNQVHQLASMNARKEISTLTGQYLALDDVVNWTKVNANGGDATSQYNFGWMYSAGTNLPTNHDMAVYWYRLAAQQGDPGAQNNLGVCYMLGYGVPRDPFKALQWFDLATHSEGDRRPLPYQSEPIQWEDEAATASFRLAEYRTTRSHRDGIGMIYDSRSVARADSIECYLQDVSRAEYNLGITLLDVCKVDRLKDFGYSSYHMEDEARNRFADDPAGLYNQCFRRAAYFDHAGAQYHLGMRQLESEGFKCGDESMNWFQRSAEQDHIGSLHILATLYSQHNRAVAAWAAKRYSHAIERLLVECRLSVERYESELHRAAITWYTTGGLRCDVPDDLRLHMIYDVGDNDWQGFDWTSYLSQFDSVTYDFISDAFRDPECEGETHFLRGLIVHLYSHAGHGEYEISPTYMFRRDGEFQHFSRAASSPSNRMQHLDSEIDYSSGHPGAMNNLGIIYALGHEDVRNYEAAISQFRRAAELGHFAAQFNLGVCYSMGIGVRVDHFEAFRWFRRSADSSVTINCRRVAGHSLRDWPYVRSCPELVDALYNVGVCYIRGLGVSRDVDLSLQYLSRAAEQGDEKAQHCLALPELGQILDDVPSTNSSRVETLMERAMHSRKADRHSSRHTVGPHRLPRHVLRLHHSLSDHRDDQRTLDRVHGFGDSEDLAALGWMYALGIGVPRDSICAFRWFAKASQYDEEPYRDTRGVFRNFDDLPWTWRLCSTGSASGLDVLPWSLRFLDSDTLCQIDVSDSGRSNSETCRRWAELGDPDAQYFYAWMCANGEGVQRSLSEALRWYRLAALQGHVSASYRLALIYDEGQGVVSDPSEAAKWYQRSAKRGIVDAQYRLALLYEEGRGVQMDLATAAGWYQMAAAQRDLQSMYRLCVMSQSGESGTCSRSYDLFSLYDEILRDREVSDLDWNAEPIAREVQPSGFRLTAWDHGCGSR